MDISAQSALKLLHRFHGIVFVIFVLGGLIVMILALNAIITSSSPDAAVTPPALSGFDKDTIEKLSTLRSSGEQTPPLDFSGRSNPFAE